MVLKINHNKLYKENKSNNTMNLKESSEYIFELIMILMFLITCTVAVLTFVLFPHIVTGLILVAVTIGSMYQLHLFVQAHHPYKRKSESRLSPSGKFIVTSVYILLFFNILSMVLIEQYSFLSIIWTLFWLGFTILYHTMALKFEFFKKWEMKDKQQ